MSFKSLTERIKAMSFSNERSERACPVCADEISEQNSKVVRATISNLAEDNPRWFDFFYGGSEERALEALTQASCRWACDSCLSSGAAIVGDYKKQEFLDWPPYLAYVDRSLTCRSCGCKFTFGKEEQVYWYETLGFWVQSSAVNCKSCRKSLREARDAYAGAQREIEKLKSSADLTDVDQLLRLIALYEQTDSHKKVGFYTSALRRLEKRKLVRRWL